MAERYAELWQEIQRQQVENNGCVYVKDGLMPSDESGGIDTGSESLVQQEFAKEADINWIVKRYDPQSLAATVDAGFYGDFTALPSYQEALNTAIKAEQMFMALPSDLRSRFENSPQKLLDFLNDPANTEEVYKLGLAKRREPSDADRIVQAVDRLANVDAREKAGTGSPPAS